MIDQALMTEVLVAHQRRDAGSCICGWNRLGYSHAQHQADAILTALNAKPEWSDPAPYWDLDCKGYYTNGSFHGGCDVIFAPRTREQYDSGMQEPLVWRRPMSADNYYTIKQDDAGKYVAVMGFMSNLEDGHLAEIRPNHKRFDTWADAAQYAMSDYAEYGLIEETSTEGV